MPHSDGDLWTCPKCGEKFAGANMWHSCGRYTIEGLFAKCDPVVLETYRAFEKAALEIAPFHVIPQKTRVVFQLRIRCTGATPTKRLLRVHFITRAPIESPRVAKVEQYAKNQFGNYVPLHSPDEVDDEVREWIRLSTFCGEQK
ncbi:MAG TPA: DUF5655 domain-containing protein [Fimbriimonadaceae bacterium]|nr:DUF5655 domain-containing protein [Fimbriimonadaceae bacterium]